jgi:hypothetical protein
LFFLFYLFAHQFTGEPMNARTRFRYRHEPKVRNEPAANTSGHPSCKKQLTTPLNLTFFSFYLFAHQLTGEPMNARTRFRYKHEPKVSNEPAAYTSGHPSRTKQLPTPLNLWFLSFYLLAHQFTSAPMNARTRIRYRHEPKVTNEPATNTSGHPSRTKQLTTLINRQIYVLLVKYDVIIM